MTGKKYLKPEEVAAFLASHISDSQRSSGDSYQIVSLTRQEVAKAGGRAVAKDAFMRDVSAELKKKKAFDMVDLTKDCEKIYIYPDAEVKTFTEIAQENNFDDGDE